MLSLYALSFVSSVLFAITFILVHFLRRDLNAIRFPLSKYVPGEKAYVLTAGLYLIGLAEILLAFGFQQQANIFGQLLLIGAGLGAITVALFKIEEPKVSVYGYLHDFGAAMQFTLFPLALLFLSEIFIEGSLYSYTLFTSYLNFFLLTIILYLHVYRNSFREKYYGAVQKINMIFMNAWVVGVSFSFLVS